MVASFEQRLDADLNTLIDEALKYIQQLSAPADSEAESFDFEFFRKESANAAKVLAHNATKLSLTAPPKSKDAFTSTKQIVDCMRHLVALALSIPKSSGSTLTTHIRSVISEVVFDIASHANAFLTTARPLSEVRNLGYLSATGIVWKGCDIMQQIPITNAKTVQYLVKRKLELVEDAVTEMEGLLEEDGGDDGG
ncbi:Cyclin-D1-binding protein 1, partial [Rhizophlyctis rosea]